jgi:hypothetical protein
MGLLGTARGAVAASRNRIGLTAAHWNAAACLAHAQSALRAALLEEGQRQALVTARAWHELNQELEASPPPPEYRCERTAVPVGARLDVNTADPRTLRHLFLSLAVPAVRADSAASALVRARPLVNSRQLRQVAGIAGMASLVDKVIDVEPGPIAINHAPAEILGLLPGFSADLVEHVMDARRRNAPIATFADLWDGLSPSARDSLAPELARLPAVVVLEPKAWVLTARSTVGVPPVTAVIEARIERSGWRNVGVVRRRSWIE